MRLLTAFGSAAALAVGLTVLASPASAAPDRAVTAATPAGVADAGSSRQLTSLTVAGFDRKVAAANGYDVRTRPDGREYAIKRGATTGGVALPANEVEGNCGSSWVEFDATGNLRAQLGTGFDVYLPAVTYQWRVTITDQVGVGNVNWASRLNPHRKSWAAVTTTRSGARGSAFAVVATPYSLAVLENGALCRSGGPTSYTNYY